MRVAATTAVVAGTAGAVHHHQEQRYANQAADQQAQADAQAQQAYDAQQAQMYAQQQQMYAQQQAAAAAPAGVDLNAQLQQLATLHAQGILSDAEFTAAKAKLLG
jgi:hypothetical protein